MCVGECGWYAGECKWCVWMVDMCEDGVGVDCIVCVGECGRCVGECGWCVGECNWCVGMVCGGCV